MAHKYRIPGDSEYISALGQAIYNFTYLEWVVINLIEALKPGYIRSDHHRKSAGQIGREFKTTVSRAELRDPEVLARLEKLASEFLALSERRNDLLHAHPYTEEGGAQQLIRRRRDDMSFLRWTLDDVHGAAHAFEAAAIEGSNLCHDHLQHND